MIKRVKQEAMEGDKILTWAFPGGKQKFGENRQECVEREVLAETGYKISVVKEISLRVPQESPIILAYHLCRLVDSNPVTNPSQPWEVEEVKWVDPKQLKELITTSLDPNVAQELGI